ncbi:MAG: hypothetical protein M3P51_06425 [Chloroflexota bacterium]|nr:hypothetical protein [Chloroflexota bacterium]
MRRFLVYLAAALLLLLSGFGLATALLLRERAIPPQQPPRVAEPVDLVVTIDRELFVREANRRALPVLADYDLRDPEWRLGDDNTVTISATGKLPIIGTDVPVQVVGQPVVRDGSVAVEILSVTLGSIEVSGDQLSGLAEGLNQQLADAIDREKYAVEDVRASEDAVTVRLRVIGEL